MTGQSHLETTTQSGTKDGRHDRLLTILQLFEHHIKVRFLERLAQFGDVGTGKEGATGTGQHNPLHAVIGQQFGQPFMQGHPHSMTQCIHRRAVDG